MHDMQSRELLGTKCTQQMRQAPYAAVWADGHALRQAAKHVPAQCHITCGRSLSTGSPASRPIRLGVVHADASAPRPKPAQSRDGWEWTLQRCKSCESYE